MCGWVLRPTSTMRSHSSSTSASTPITSLPSTSATCTHAPRHHHHSTHPSLRVFVMAACLTPVGGKRTAV